MERKEEDKKGEEEDKVEVDPSKPSVDDDIHGVVKDQQIHPNIKQKKISPFINSKKSWDDEEYKIPAEIKKGIKDGLNWERPSRIQAMAIPYIITPDEETKEYESLIAQARNGAGKSGAFIIGSLLRIDPTIKKTQVVVIAHSRELVNQLAGVIARILEHAPSYRLCNLATDKPDASAHIVVSTLGFLLNQLTGRTKTIDLSQLRVFVLDEADAFFNEETRKNEIMKFHGILQGLKRKIQYIFFSATFEEEVSKDISQLVSEAYQISLQLKAVKLENVQQLYYKCPPRGKINFIKEIFDSFSNDTQTIIFMNTLNFAETLFYDLKKDGYKCALIFGRMTKDERDEYIEKFRKGDISVIITTNLLSRGFDMQQIKLVINFDVPTQEGNPDYENYMHRVGRSGRFGDSGLALTLFDREQDEAAFW